MIANAASESAIAARTKTIIKPSTFIAHMHSHITQGTRMKTSKMWSKSREQLDQGRNYSLQNQYPHRKIALQKGNFAFYVIKSECKDDESQFQLNAQQNSL